MAGQQSNKMGRDSMKRLIWGMGLPMIISMVLQALYNVVDSIFVANMGAEGAVANQALTIAFPVQIMIIALGVGTGVGINALLSKSLGENNSVLANKVAGNGIFLSIVIYAVFLVFGVFFAKGFISLFANGDAAVISMGTSYLRIVTIFSFGGIAFTVFERLLQATGKTVYSMAAQISGAVTNIILDYIFIYPLGMGVAGAAAATVIGQFVSLFVAAWFHYGHNREIDGSLKFIRPEGGIIRGIYSIGASAAVMQALLSVMMAGMNAILNTADADPTILVGSFGIYYKIQQIALFAAFGLSNTMISVLAFNYGMRNKQRSRDCIRYGIQDTLLVMLIITVIFQIFASALASLFGLAGDSTKEIIDVCKTAIRIASLGYLFMGFSVAVQGALQALRYAGRPLLISLLRLVIFVFPIAYYFTGFENVTEVVWWTFPITEILTAVISAFILRATYKSKIETMEDAAVPAGADSIESGAGQRRSEGSGSDGLHGKSAGAGAAASEADGQQRAETGIVLAISRQHGTNGKRIARMAAESLGLAFYDKEEVKNYAAGHGLVQETDDKELYRFFLSLDVEKNSIIKQAEAIRSIEKEGSCVIVGRGADHVLDSSRVVRIFLYAPEEYRIGNIMKNYEDSYKDAKKHIQDSDVSRARYYDVIAGKTWGDKDNYDLCINCEIGDEKVKELICSYVKSISVTE
ncbi:MAG: MATE family efflux transporter [Lachnospiraceae bacterium]|nr:MATE family efflux transporter [Lachnospiraceae bacterium]